MGNFWNFKIGLFSAQLESKRFQCSSVTQSCRTLCNPMNRSTPGHPVQHQLLEATQTHVSDDIQPSNPLSSPSPAALNLSQHQGFFKWGVISPLSSILGTYQSGEFFQYPIFCLFILFMVFSRQEYGSGLPFPSPVKQNWNQDCQEKYQ